MIQGYKRTLKHFDWGGTTVWIKQVSKVERQAIFTDDDLNARFVELVMHTITNEQGELLFTDREATVKYFDENVSEADCKALADLVIQHNGWGEQKKS